MDWDVIVVGSGFGGSVAALRLAEKGYRVLVLEQGLRVDSARIKDAHRQVSKLMWEPKLGMHGFFRPRLFRHLAVLTGIGVGGGSLVYAAVLLRPQRGFFENGAWSRLGVPWEGELAPHYATAERMLGAQETPHHGHMDESLRRTAEAMGAGSTFGPTVNGIYFGTPGVEERDPYFGGRGPARRGCTLCGGCLAGCPIGAKNSLDKNYLHLASRLGATVWPRVKVTHLERIPGGYRVHTTDALDGASQVPLTATRVVLAAGAIGTMELLFRSRDGARTLPRVSRALGQVVRTNSEAIVGILSSDPDANPDGDGATISSHFYADARTHVTQNRMSPAMAAMRFQLGPLVDDTRPWRRALKTMTALARSPRELREALEPEDWHRRITMLTVMQDADNSVGFRWARGLGAGAGALRSVAPRGERAPSYLPVANDAARAFAGVAGGTPKNVLFDSVGNRSVTAHVLGGCAIGSDPDRGVVDANHEVFGYPGLYVVDASAIPANVGVNPALTIAALAERAMDRIPAKVPVKVRRLHVA